jgi:hypothetical protein
MKGVPMQSILEEIKGIDVEPEDSQEVISQALSTLSGETVQNPVVQVTLEPGDLSVTRRSIYEGMWNIFFVSKQWFFHENNYEKLAKIMPAFIVVEFKKSPFRSHGLVPAADGEPEPDSYRQVRANLDYLHQMFTTHYVILPFKVLRANQIEFIGAKFNKVSTQLPTFNMRNYQDVIIQAFCAYGYFAGPKRRIGLEYVTDYGLRSLHIHMDRAKPYIIDVYKACENEILKMFGN